MSSLFLSSRFSSRGTTALLDEHTAILRFKVGFLSQQLWFQALLFLKLVIFSASFFIPTKMQWSRIKLRLDSFSSLRYLVVCTHIEQFKIRSFLLVKSCIVVTMNLIICVLWYEFWKCPSWGNGALWEDSRAVVLWQILLQLGLQTK